MSLRKPISVIEPIHSRIILTISTRPMKWDTTHKTRENVRYLILEVRCTAISFFNQENYVLILLLHIQ